MSNFKVGDKVRVSDDGGVLSGCEVTIVEDDYVRAGPYAVVGCKETNNAYWLVSNGVLIREDRLTPAAPPKLGKVRVVVYPNGEAGAWSEQESAYAASARALTPGELKFDRIIPLDALDADRKRADHYEKVAQEQLNRAEAAERRADTLAERCNAYHKRMLAAEKRCGELELAESSIFRAAPADLVSLDELWEKHRLYVGRDLDSGWSVFNCNFMYAHGFQRTFPTHAAAWKAASEWARKEAGK